jgi:hydrogenase expression/formation protein HypC
MLDTEKCYTETMCIAYPGKIIEVDENKETARVDFNGSILPVNIRLIDAVKGDFVLAHAGFATTKISKKDAKEITEAFLET